MIGSQNAVLNQYAPSFCIRTPVAGEVLVYDSSKKSWINSPTVNVDVDTFTGLSDTPINFSNAAGFILSVAPTEDSVVFIPEIDAGDWDVPIVSTTPTFVISGDTLGTFTGLVDTPSNYNGSANYILQVNATETAVEFASYIDGGSY